MSSILVMDGSDWLKLVGAIVLLALFLFFVPKLQIRSVRNEKDSKGPLELENEYRQTLAQLFGGLAIIATIYFAVDSAKLARESLKHTADNIELTRRSYELTRESYDLTRRGQVADRTFKAMEMLSKNENNKDATTAAIYVLGQIAEEDPGSEWTTTETLFNYLKGHAKWSKKSVKRPSAALKTDLSAILDYLRRRPWKKDDGTCVEYHQCIDYQKGMTPDTSHSQYFDIINLPEVDLRGAFLERAMLKKVILRDSHLEKARLRCGHFEGSYLANTSLFDARLGGSYWNWANLMNANLSCSHWHNADMSHIYLDKAKLYGADLTGAVGLSREQLQQAQGDAATKLSDETLRPTNWDRTRRMKCPKSARIESIKCANE